MSSNITSQQIEDLKLFSTSSIAVDQSWDINETAQVSLFVRFISSTAPKKELLGLLPLKGQTCGEDIAYAAIEYIEKDHFPRDKIVSVSTNDAESLTGITVPYVCKRRAAYGKFAPDGKIRSYATGSSAT
ncbi:hypothetical protein AVEN_197035-1 [Araneus ventricosus]|uniref:Uncharacterized protein n=1 Tax=Araneus ventricosus TaxID=182803 RepID=A0A4Y2GE76_ARAVE|nr:hypothetical protein AVEN_197035-1 [Araneus ventricosus]